MSKTQCEHDNYFIPAQLMLETQCEHDVFFIEALNCNGTGTSGCESCLCDIFTDAVCMRGGTLANDV